jgi:hypothetical protein
VATPSHSCNGQYFVLCVEVSCPFGEGAPDRVKHSRRRFALPYQNSRLPTSRRLDLFRPLNVVLELSRSGNACCCLRSDSQLRRHQHQFYGPLHQKRALLHRDSLLRESIRKPPVGAYQCFPPLAAVASAASIRLQCFGMKSEGLDSFLIGS